MWLGKGELASLVRILRVSVVKYMANTASRGRRPYLLSAILFPSEQGSSRVGERPLPQTRKRRTERRTVGRKP